MMAAEEKACELCVVAGGEILYEEEKFRVVLVDDAQYPGFCRVIWNGHAREMTDLLPLERILLMDAVWQAESAMREVMCPDKINVASLGNVVPHLHWHIIPRYADDMHFPGPVWAQPQRTPAENALTERRSLLPALRQALKSRFADQV